jgi:hypothetical protein
MTGPTGSPDPAIRYIVAGTGTSYSHTSGQPVEWGPTIEVGGASLGTWSGTNQTTFTVSEAGVYLVSGYFVLTSVSSSFNFYIRALQGVSAANFGQVTGSQSTTMRKISFACIILCSANDTIIGYQLTTRTLDARQIRIQKL